MIRCRKREVLVIVLLMVISLAAGVVWGPQVTALLGVNGQPGVSQEIQDIRERLERLESEGSEMQRIQMAALEMDLDRWMDLLQGFDAIQFRSASVSAMEWVDGELVLTVTYNDTQKEASIAMGTVGIYLQSERGLAEADEGTLYDKFLSDQETGQDEPYTLVFTDQRLRQIYQGEYEL